MPRLTNSLVHSNLDSYLVRFLFNHDIKTQDQLFREIRKPYSETLDKLEKIDSKKLVTAFFSLN